MEAGDVFLRIQNFCHTRVQLTIPDPLIIIPDDQLGPQVALYSTYPSRPAIRPAYQPSNHPHIMGNGHVTCDNYFIWDVPHLLHGVVIFFKKRGFESKITFCLIQPSLYCLIHFSKRLPQLA